MDVWRASAVVRRGDYLRRLSRTEQNCTGGVSIKPAARYIFSPPFTAVVPAARDALVRRFAAFGAVNKTGRFVVGGGRFRGWWAAISPVTTSIMGSPRAGCSGLLPGWPEKWKVEYKKGTIIEWYFSSGKLSRLLDTHRHHNIFGVSAYVAVSMLLTWSPCWCTSEPMITPT